MPAPRPTKHSLKASLSAADVAAMRGVVPFQAVPDGSRFRVYFKSDADKQKFSEAFRRRTELRL